MYADIILFRETHSIQPLTYSVGETTPKLGQIVEIPFRGRREKGIISNIHNQTPEFAVLPIIKILSQESIFSDQQQKLFNFCISRYFCTPSKAISLFYSQQIISENGIPPMQKGWKLSKSDIHVTGKKQIEAIQCFQSPEEIIAHEVFINKKISASTITTLTKKHIITEVQNQEYIYTPFLSSDIYKNIPYIKQIHSHSSFLIGSNKSQRNIYTLSTIFETLKSGKQVLFILPEQASCFMRATSFKNIINPKQILCSTGKDTPIQRRNAFWKIRSQNVNLIVGTKMSLFYPFQNLGLIIIEDPQESSYKNEKLPKYQAKEIVQELSQIHNAQVIYQSVTPSIQDLYYAKQKNFLVQYFESISPPTHIIDMNQEEKNLNLSPLSLKAEKIIEQNIKNKQQSLIFINQRGLYKTLFCNSCHHIEICKRCNSPMNIHTQKGKKILLCHICTNIQSYKNNCSECKKPDLIEKGYGTQKIELYLQKRFPQAHIERADRDSMQGKRHTQDIFEAFAQGEIDILIGTQMILKSFQFPYLNTAIGLNMESPLFIPDFRSQERIFHQIQYLKERIGNKTSSPQVLIQTHMPSHPIFSQAITGDWKQFYQQHIKERKELFLPPFCEIIKIEFSEESFNKALEIAQKSEQIYKKIPLSQDIRTIISPGYPSEKNGKHIVNLYIYSNHTREILTNYVPKNGKIDINPENIG